MSSLANLCGNTNYWMEIAICTLICVSLKYILWKYDSHEGIYWTSFEFFWKVSPVDNSTTSRITRLTAIQGTWSSLYIIEVFSGGKYGFKSLAMHTNGHVRSKRQTLRLSNYHESLYALLRWIKTSFVTRNHYNCVSDGQLV